MGNHFTSPKLEQIYNIQDRKLFNQPNNRLPWRIYVRRIFHLEKLLLFHDKYKNLPQVRRQHPQGDPFDDDRGK